MSAKGFTIVELLVVMGIFAILASLSTLNLSHSQHASSVNATVETLVSDLKRQQHKAMIGDTEGRGTASNYGIHFDSVSYVLFHDIYNPSGSDNFIVNSEGTLIFSTTGEVIYTKGSGESTGLTSVTVYDTVTSLQKTLNINKYGVITSIN